MHDFTLKFHSPLISVSNTENEMGN